MTTASVVEDTAGAFRERFAWVGSSLRLRCSMLCFLLMMDRLIVTKSGLLEAKGDKKKRTEFALEGERVGRQHATTITNDR